MRASNSLVLSLFGLTLAAACGGGTDLSVAPFSGEGGAGGDPSTTASTTSTSASSASGTATSSSVATSSSSSGTGGSAGFCGSGTFDTFEECDDGNAASGDGCSNICVAEDGWACIGQPSTCFPLCGDGLLLGSEACDDGSAAAGDGCSAACDVEDGFSCAGAPSVCAPTCGDGKVLGGEACDDGNTGGNDGCDAACVVEAGYACAGAPSVCVPACGDGLVGNGEGCDDANGTLGDGCAACAVEPGYACAGAPSVCGALCGDGVILLAEACDDGNTTNGDGCKSTCTVDVGYACTGMPSACAPVCGDGITISAETCDDANGADGDGCSAACAFEGAIAEIEANDTLALADASTLQLTGSRVITGAIAAVGDIDFYRLTLAADGVVRFETAETLSPFDCPSLTTTLRVYDGAGTELYSNNTSGILSCSGLVLGLTAGVYYASVEETGNNGTIAQYHLDVALHGDVGAETEANDATSEANHLLGTNIVITGDHSVAAESDYYLIDVPVGGLSLRAETIEAPGGETCESNGMNARVSLYDTNGGNFISDDDDAGRGACARVDGTGNAPSNTGSHDLAAGTYYLRVRAATIALGSSGQFSYRLAMTLR